MRRVPSGSIVEGVRAMGRVLPLPTIATVSPIQGLNVMSVIDFWKRIGSREPESSTVRSPGMAYISRCAKAPGGVWFRGPGDRDETNPRDRCQRLHRWSAGPDTAGEGLSRGGLARDPRKLSGRGWGDGVEVVAGDVLDRDSLGPAWPAAARRITWCIRWPAASGFRRARSYGRSHFTEASARAGLERIIYLGGLGKRSDRQSAHLGSRHEVGDILRSGAVPVYRVPRGHDHRPVSPHSR